MPQAEPLTAQQLAEIETGLQHLRDALSGQLERGGEESKPVQLDQQMVGRLSRMDAMQQQQMAAASLTHVREHLRQVQLALAAIASGDYGFCSSCDEPIGWPRLQARPDTALCINCQQATEM